MKRKNSLDSRSIKNVFPCKKKKKNTVKKMKIHSTNWQNTYLTSTGIQLYKRTLKTQLNKKQTTQAKIKLEIQSHLV